MASSGIFISVQAEESQPQLENPALVNPAVVPVPNEIDAFWMPRHIEKIKEINEHPAANLVMIGDSITQSLEQNGPEPWNQMKSVWDRYYAPFKAVNLGFNSDNTANVLWRLQNGEIDNLHPKVVVLEIGANNTGRKHWSAQQTLEGIEAIVSLVHTKIPETKIIVLNILPCGYAFAEEVNSQINAALAQKFANSDFVFVTDFSNIFMQDGKLNRNLFVEGKVSLTSEAVHPSSEGHEKIAKTLQPMLQKLMEESD